ncbi:hypothetical protein [Aeoliella sp.]|uniref:hypothetical protein n=1 Tax=Aeoliella sp. TaxID=2795800 RepID=UPI003CCBBFB2
MYKIILPAAALVAFTFLVASADTADAKHFRRGGVSVTIGHGGGFHGGYYPGGWGHGCHYGNGWGWGGGHSWHDTSHWDYHPPQLVPHGNHFHVQPGHWDWHQDGHWHHNHP